MASLTQAEFWVDWLRIVLIDLALAGDNALVIALAVRSLPEREQFLGRIYGTLGAVLLRVLFVFVVTILLRIPFLQLAGGLMLIWIAFKLVHPHHDEPDNARRGSTLREAVGIIILADVVMSLDNVIAIAAAARGNLVLVLFGLALSLPLVVWGSGLLARIMNRFPIIIWIGGGVLGFVAMEMILRDEIAIHWLGARHGDFHHVAPTLLGVAFTGLGWWLARRTPPAGESAPLP